jgi:hypothetical protein
MLTYFVIGIINFIILIVLCLRVLVGKIQIFIMINIKKIKLFEYENKFDIKKFL